jgi:glycosyltransferase involved in cell wall biosynthesis
VLPYRAGTQSGVTHVAYALGSPVIATRVGGLTESVREGETGLTCPPEDPGALAAALVRFFAEGLGERMRGPIAALRASHSWDALARATVEFIDSLKPGRGWA